MTHFGTPIERLMILAQCCAQHPIVDIFANQIVDAAHTVICHELWIPLAEALSQQSIAVQEQARLAVAKAIEEPLLTTKEGNRVTGTLLLLPISLLATEGVFLKALPQAEVFEKILNQALCPNGKGVLLNGLVADKALKTFSFQQIWELVNEMANAPAGTYWHSLDPFTKAPAKMAYSGLFYLPYLVLQDTESQYSDIDWAQKALSEETASAIEVVASHLKQILLASEAPVEFWLHPPMTYYSDSADVHRGHEIFLLEHAILTWQDLAADEGLPLSLRVMMERSNAGSAFVVQASVEEAIMGTYRIDCEQYSSDDCAEFCVVVTEVAAGDDSSVEFSGEALTLHRRSAKVLTLTSVSPDDTFVVEASLTLQ